MTMTTASRVQAAAEIHRNLTRIGAMMLDEDRARVVKHLNEFMRDGTGSKFSVLSGTTRVTLSATRQCGIETISTR